MSLPLLLQPGTRIGGQYTVDTLINSGGFGAVYRGYDAGENNRLCAIKETYDVSPAARRKALREVGILLAIKNQHLPEVYDAFEGNGRFYVVMQLIEGQNLLQMLKARGAPFSEREVLGWLLPIMDVLQELHSRPTPVIHRDIKPANIIITRNQCAVLVDFGLTKLYSPEDTTQTIERAVSLGFSPIEQYVGTTSPQSDIYSLAATMYMLLTNVTPPSAMQRSYRDELLAPRLFNSAISPTVERALLRGLALQAKDRFESMRAFAQALQGSIPTITTRAPVKSNVTAGTSVKQVPPSMAYAGGSVISQQRKQQLTGSMRVSARPLPGAFNQGCLWGALQGILAALIVLILRKEADFYVAIAAGFVFYFIAGVLTTHRGGKASRGAWAGFWSGVISTIMFWLALGTGLFILVLQRTSMLQQRGITPQPDKEFYRIWHLIMPVIYNHPIVQMRPVLVLSLFLACGLLLAIGCGWFGGVLAKRNYKARKKAKRNA